MTAPLLATRDALVKALDGHAYTYPDWFCECSAYLSGSWADWRDHVAEALTGVVRDPATLADDEALVERLVESKTSPFISQPEAKAGLRALAAALTADPS